MLFIIVYTEQAITLEDDATSGSWANRLPGSLVPPMTSPVKKSPVKDVSPVKVIRNLNRTCVTTHLGFLHCKLDCT